MENHADEEPNDIDPRPEEKPQGEEEPAEEEQSTGESIALSTEPPVMNEVVLDKNDQTCAWASWEGTQTDGQERYKIAWWTDETDKREAETNSRNYPLPKLKEGVTYFANVSQYIDENFSDPSNTIKFETGPKAPSTIEVSNYEPSPHDHLLVKFKNTNAKPVEHLVMLQPISGEEIKPIPVRRGQNFALVKDLIPGQFYEIQVAAVIGELTSDIVTFPEMVQTYPGIPVGVDKETTRDGIKLRWQHLEIKPRKYIISWEANGKEEISETTQNHYSITNLKPSTIYKFTVSAVNDAGEGEKSEEVEHITDPSAPTNITVAPNPRAKTRSFIVKYEDPDPVLKKKYLVVANGMDGNEAARTVSDTHTAVLNDLSPGQAYYIYVVALYGTLKSPKAHYNNSPSTKNKKF